MQGPPSPQGQEELEGAGEAIDITQGLEILEQRPDGGAVGDRAKLDGDPQRPHPNPFQRFLPAPQEPQNLPETPLDLQPSLKDPKTPQRPPETPRTDLSRANLGIPLGSGARQDIAPGLCVQ